MARFARYQQEKYSSRLMVEGKVVDVWVAKDFAFFTFGSSVEGIQVSWMVVWSSGCQRKEEPLSHRQFSFSC
jgi:hypothetical protein